MTQPGDPGSTLDSGRFALFGESLLVGVMVAASSVVVVTFLPALAAGSSHLRRHLTGQVDSVRSFGSDFVAAVRTLWTLALGWAIVVGLLTLNTQVLAAGEVPGGRPLAAVMFGLAVVVSVVCLRVAALWRPGPLRAGELLRAAARISARDLSGSVLIVVAVALSILLVWMLLPLFVIVPGLLVLALVAVEQRQVGRPAQSAE
jgi:hypothetical protein